RLRDGLALRGLRDLAGAQAAGAHLHLALDAFDHGAHVHEVRVEAAVGDVVGVAHAIPGERSLVAQFTALSHRILHGAWSPHGPAHHAKPRLYSGSGGSPSGGAAIPGARRGRAIVARPSRKPPSQSASALWCSSTSANGRSR